MRRKQETQYLRIIGRLHPDNHLELRPGYLTTSPHNPKQDPESSLIAELYDKESKLLLRYRVHTRRYCVDGRTLPEMAVRGEIPFPPPTKTVRFLRDNVIIHEINVSEGKPEVRVTWERARVRGKQVITWVGRHPNKVSLQYFLRYTHDDGKTWQRIGWRTAKMKHEIDFDQLPGGKRCRVAIVATDGVNTTMVKSKVFSVSVKPCKAMIFTPEDGATFAPDETIFLRGQGYYMEENKAEKEALYWTSSENGKLGQGTIVKTRKLSLGTHRITLTAGKGSRLGTAIVSIHIRTESKKKDIPQ